MLNSISLKLCISLSDICEFHKMISQERTTFFLEDIIIEDLVPKLLSLMV
jgi:hypothetical protein